MHTRTDRATATLVDLAVNLAASHGVAAGANVLFRNGLSLELARRVLLMPMNRRCIGRVRGGHYHALRTLADQPPPGLS